LNRRTLEFPSLKNVLVAAPFSREDLGELSGLVNLHWLDDMSESELDSVLPQIDCIFVHLWPRRIGSERMKRMRSLSFVQSALAGVNHIPFRELRAEVVVSSNAGGYSDEVGEFAWALVLAAAKRVVESQVKSKEGGYGASPLELGKKVLILKGKTLGILGYGGIGSAVAKIGRAFGMRVLVLSRKNAVREGVESVGGEDGLRKLLKDSDVVVLSLPLTNSTRRMIGQTQLEMMRRDAILVNVARAEIVEQQALYEHLRVNERFVYATDVWWTKDGRECYPPELPFFELGNFIGTPHVAGPSAVVGGGPLSNALANLARYARGEGVLNVVDRSDYL
jgi:phosphoglycerate dehydrogenase-like enzyme